MATDNLHAPVDCSSSWEQALAEWSAALHAANAASDREHETAEAFAAICPDEEPLKERIRKYLPYQHPDVFLQTLDLEEHWQKFLAAEGKVWWAADPEAKKQNVRALLDDILTHRRARQAAMLASGREKACDDYDAAWDLEYRTRFRLMAIPAPNKAAALIKLELLFGDEEMAAEEEFSPAWAKDYISPALADFRRLLGEAA